MNFFRTILSHFRPFSVTLQEKHARLKKTQHVFFLWKIWRFDDIKYDAESKGRNSAAPAHQQNQQTQQKFIGGTYVFDVFFCIFVQFLRIIPTVAVAFLIHS